MLTGALTNRVPAHDDHKEPTFDGRFQKAVGAAGSPSLQSHPAGASSASGFWAISGSDFQRSFRWAQQFDNQVAAQIRERLAEVEARKRALATCRGRIRRAWELFVDGLWFAWMICGAVCLALWLCVEYAPAIGRRSGFGDRSSVGKGGAR